MLLAIDTATSWASIALHDGAMVRGECTWEAVNRHTVTLLPRVDQMLAAADIAPADLTALAVCEGPGSYTGVRIGVSVAKGLAVTLGVPLIGVPTLDILVAAQPPDPRVLYALFSAGRMRVGYARYRWREGAWRTEDPIAIATWEELAQRIEQEVPPLESALVVGELPALGREALRSLGERVDIPPAARHVRRAGFLAEAAWTQLRVYGSQDLTTVQPRYAR